MFKKILLIFLSVFIYELSFSQIIVDTNTYTIEELVTEVLVNNSCDAISNISYLSSSSYHPEESIAYFTNENLDAFPFSSGILLSTGFAINAEGPNDNINADGITEVWVGDNQLLNYISSVGIDPDIISTHNASVIEFDFVPIDEYISFDFIFASDEYGTYQCDWSDAFAFFLTDTTTEEVTNLALVPNTETPISVITIRDTAYNNFCGSVNAEYFNNFYEYTDLDAPHNFNGETKIFTAQSNVVSGRTYHIKLVIADRNDGSIDSIVFLEAGSFDLTGVELGGDLTLENGTAVCDEEYLLSVELESFQSIQWYLDDVLIEEENGEEITVTENGTYSIEVTYENLNCSITDEITIEFFTQSFENPENIVVQLEDCTQNFEETIDLNERGLAYLNLNENDYSIEYYPTQEDAENQTNIITNPETYLVTNANQQVFVRIEYLALGCTTIVNFGVDLIISTLNIAEVEKNFCLNNSIYTVQLQDYNTDYLDQFNGDLNITYYYTFEDAENNINPIDPAEVLNIIESTTFYVSIETTNDIVCTVVTTLVLTAYDTIVIPAIPDLQLCDIDSDTQEIIVFEALKDYIDTYIVIPNTYQVFITEEDALNNENPLLNDFNQNSIVQTYYIRITSLDACYSITSVDIQLQELPSLSVEAENESICILEDAVFVITDYDSTLEYDFVYNNQTYDITNSTFSILELQQTTTIEVNVTNPTTGCTNQVFVEQNVNDFPEINSVENNFCINNVTDYTVQLQEFDSYFNDQSNENLVIRYFYTIEDAESNINPIASTDVLTLTESTRFYVLIGLNEELVCTDITSLDLIAYDTVENSNLPNLELCDNLGDNQEIISLNYLQTHINGFVSALYDYQIFITEQEALINENSLLNDYIQTATNQSYFIRISSSDGCYTISSFDVYLIEAPSLNIEVYNNAICYLDDAVFTITDFNASYNYSYVYKSQTYPVTEATFTVLEPTESFTLEVNVINPITGCNNQTLVDQNVNGYPEIFALNPLEEDGFEVIYAADQPVEFSINGIDWQTSPIFNNLDSEIYEVQIRLVNHLCYGNTQEIFLYVINNIITPNGDGINDYFNLPAIQNNPSNEQDLSVKIFDRYGKIIKEHSSKNKSFTWDGTYLGRPVPTDSYWYIIQLPDGREYRGSITVKNK